MKIIGTFGVVVIASIALLQPADGRPRGGGGGGGRSFSSGHSFSSGSARHYSGGSRNFSRSNARAYGSTPRYSSQRSFRNSAYSRSNSSRRFSSQPALRNRSSNPRYASNRTNSLNRSSNPRLATNRTNEFNRRTVSDSNAQLAPNRRGARRTQGFHNNGERVAGNHTRNWNRNRDYHWRGNRCRWHNNNWVIIGPWFPWGYGYGYGYYPYASYSYYDDRYYDDGYYANEYQQSEYDGEVNFNVSEVQSALARAGYYDGAIDGSLGPATRSALRRYQRDRGLSVTGRIDQSVVEALRVR